MTGAWDATTIASATGIKMPRFIHDLLSLICFISQTRRLAHKTWSAVVRAPCALAGAKRMSEKAFVKGLFQYRGIGQEKWQ
jgi:UPF0716 family protein affecting phage T7 exclusion